MNRLIPIALGIVVLGCGEQENAAARFPVAAGESAEVKVTTKTVMEGLDKICKAYESEQRGKASCDMDGLSLINRLKSVEERQVCTRYFIERLFSLQLDHLSYWRQARVVDFSRRTIKEAQASLPRDDAGWEERYDLELKLLDWRKAHIERVKQMKPAKPRLDNTHDEQEDSGWRLIYYGGIETYEAALRDLELLFPYQKRQMSEETWNRIKAKLEAYLGRPIRTREQLRADHKANRNVVFTDKADE